MLRDGISEAGAPAPRGREHVQRPLPTALRRFAPTPDRTPGAGVRPERAQPDVTGSSFLIPVATTSVRLRAPAPLR